MVLPLEPTKVPGVYRRRSKFVAQPEPRARRHVAGVLRGGPRDARSRRSKGPIAARRRACRAKAPNPTVLVKLTRRLALPGTLRERWERRGHDERLSGD
jgi:hypothetical protein